MVIKKTYLFTSLQVKVNMEILLFIHTYILIKTKILQYEHSTMKTFFCGKDSVVCICILWYNTQKAYLSRGHNKKTNITIINLFKI